MRKCTALLLALGFTFSAKAQQDIPDIGIIPKDDLQMTYCPLDSEADAFILLKKGNAEFNIDYPGSIETSYRIRIKILKEKGLSRANVVIPFYSKDDMEFVKDISGSTYNLDESNVTKETELEKRGIYTKPINRNFSEVTFTLPDVRKGSVIEYTYTKVSHYFTSIDPWDFQDDIPTRVCQFTLAVPPYFDFNYFVRRTLPVDVKDDQGLGRVIKVFTMKDIPALKNEPFMSARRDYLQHIDFQLSAMQLPNQELRNFRTTWEKLVQELMTNPNFGGQIDKRLAHTDSLDAQLKGLTDPTARMSAVLEYVRNNMGWNGGHTMYSEGVKDAWDKRNGTSGDINLILIDLLREAGLDARPLLVSTRGNGAVHRTYPLLAQFDEVLPYVLINSKVYILDGVEKYLPYRLIPYDVLQTTALLMNKRGFAWVDLSSKDAMFSNVVAVNGTLDTQGELKGEATVVSEDYSKVNRRRRLDEGLERFKEAYFRKAYTNLRDDSLQISGQNDDSLPLEQDLHFSMSLQHSGDYLFLTPNLFLGLDKNPFVQESRFSDVDFGYGQRYLINGNIDIPEGYQLESLPRNIRMIMPDTSIVLERLMQLEEGRLEFRISVTFKRTNYSVDEYSGFREFYKRLFAALNEQVVIRKKS